MELVVCIADYGSVGIFVTREEAEKYNPASQGTLVYSPPEVLKYCEDGYPEDEQRVKYLKSMFLPRDIYALALTIIKFLKGVQEFNDAFMIPYNPDDTPQIQSKKFRSKALKSLREGKIFNNMEPIITEMTYEDPADRPVIDDVVSVYVKVLEDYRPSKSMKMGVEGEHGITRLVVRTPAAKSGYYIVNVSNQYELFNVIKNFNSINKIKITSNDDIAKVERARYMNDRYRADFYESIKQYQKSQNSPDVPDTFDIYDKDTMVAVIKPETGKIIDHRFIPSMDIFIVIEKLGTYGPVLPDLDLEEDFGITFLSFYDIKTQGFIDKIVSKGYDIWECPEDVGIKNNKVVIDIDSDEDEDDDN
jgi:hypothetical protein